MWVGIDVVGDDAEDVCGCFEAGCYDGLNFVADTVDLLFRGGKGWGVEDFVEYGLVGLLVYVACFVRVDDGLGSREAVLISRRSVMCFPLSVWEYSKLRPCLEILGTMNVPLGMLAID